MDSDLNESIVSYAAASSGLVVLSNEEAEKMRLLVAERFKLPTDKIWLWQYLPDAAASIAYHGGDDGLERLAVILPDTPELYLFATDDSSPPWSCVSGTGAALIGMLREQRFFEYFIVDSDLKWIIFDTHHNVLMGFGRGLRLLDRG